MIVTIIQGLWKESSKKKNYCEGACGHMVVKGRQQENKFIVKVLVIKIQINPTTYYIYGNKKKNKPKPSIIVIMITRKKWAHHNHLLYLWQHKKMNNYWIPFIVNVINDCHNNSRAVKRR